LEKLLPALLRNLGVVVGQLLKVQQTALAGERSCAVSGNLRKRLVGLASKHFPIITNQNHNAIIIKNGFLTSSSDWGHYVFKSLKFKALLNKKQLDRHHMHPTHLHNENKRIATKEDTPNSKTHTLHQTKPNR
jgi:hypothetical protein